MHSLRRSWNQVSHTKQFVSSLYATASDSPKLDELSCWNTSIAEAEKVVGYPTSFLNLRWLLSDEVANVAIHLRKLLGTNHPLLGVAKDLILNNEKPSWGLIVLLVSKAGGHNKSFSAIDKDVTAGVLHSQRVLAEVAEMLKTSNLIHKQVVNTKYDKRADANIGNKLALLSGDYLLSKSYSELASLKNEELNELISSGLRDMSEGEFVGPRDVENRPLPSQPTCIKNTTLTEHFAISPMNINDSLGDAKAEWIGRNMLSGVSLLAKSCQGALMLAGHPERMQKNAYLSGKYLALSLQARKEIVSIVEGTDTTLISAPFLFHLQENPTLYTDIENIINEEDRLDRRKLCEAIKSGYALSKTEELIKECQAMALENVMKFQKSLARTALCDILKNV